MCADAEPGAWPEPHVPGPPALLGDADQLRRVPLNIVENALNFTPPGGCVELRGANEKEGWVTLEIQDTGEGIPPEALAHVFERFYRADPSRTRQSWEVGGSSLGLSLARELVEAHGGTIAISSSVVRGQPLLCDYLLTILHTTTEKEETNFALLHLFNDLATALAVSPTDPCILPRKVISYRYHLDITFLGRAP